MSVAALSSMLMKTLRVADMGTESKARKACAEFEGVLLSSLLSQLQASFELPGSESEDPASANLRSIGMQELGKVWANSGGIGLAHMVIRQIVPNASNGNHSSEFRPVPITRDGVSTLQITQINVKAF